MAGLLDINLIIFLQCQTYIYMYVLQRKIKAGVRIS